MVAIDKERLIRYRKLCEDIDYQMERSERLAEKLKGPSSISITGMPKNQNKNDRTGMLISKKVEIDSKILKLQKEERKERKILETEFLKLEPRQAFIMSVRYIDGFEWDEINAILFKKEKDFDIEEKTTYMNRTYRLHGEALKKLKVSNKRKEKL